MIRVLHIVGTLDRGGIETFLMNCYRAVDRTAVQFDFAVYLPQKGAYEDEILELGGRVFHIASKGVSLWANCTQLISLIRREDYQIVHRHTDTPTSVFDLLFSRIAGAKNLIIHSHNCKEDSTFCEGIFSFFLKLYLKLIPACCLACSERAGIFLFGRQAVPLGKVMIVHNAIDTEGFKFNREKREQMRKKLGWENRFIIGHVGRFAVQKNHIFLIDIFHEAVKQESESRLLLIGDGEAQEAVKRYVKQLKLDEYVCFAGSCDNVSDWMQAMDLFALPSLFEGLPVVMVEAQASGLSCVVSDVITREADITGNVRFLSLSSATELWAKCMLEMRGERTDKIDEVLRAGYGVEQIAKGLENYYIEAAREV